MDFLCHMYGVPMHVQSRNAYCIVFIKLEVRIVVVTRNKADVGVQLHIGFIFPRK